MTDLKQARGLAWKMAIHANALVQDLGIPHYFCVADAQAANTINQLCQEVERLRGDVDFNTKVVENLCRDVLKENT